jgi:hypothetical protein
MPPVRLITEVISMQVRGDGKVSALLKDIPVPKMFHAEQIFPAEHLQLEEIPVCVRREMEKDGIREKIKPGMKIAVTAGSRGIRNVALITKSIVCVCREMGAEPFIVPAMGSHGGATAEGQTEILKGYGITEETMGCPIRSSMETVCLGVSETGKKVYFDKTAFEADGIIISCRIKPHNAFRGTYESGPCKMMTVGLGKQKGASLVHADGMKKIAANIPAMAKVVLKNAPVLFAIPCIENAYDETFLIEAIPAEKIMEREPELLKTAFSHMPRLIVGSCDVLVVDEIGKNYSGTGVDPNITGTFSTDVAHGGIKTGRTAFLRLSPESHGNALGVGLSSAITRAIFEEMDPEMMYPNCITSTVLNSARIPCVMATEKEAVQLCIRTCNGVNAADVRMVRIPNSLHIGRIMLSENYLADVRDGKYPGLKALDEPEELLFSGEGRIMTPVLL